MIGLEASGELPIPTRATATTTVNKQNQPQTTEQQLKTADIAKNQEK